jgi:hypothetical protein
MKLTKLKQYNHNAITVRDSIRLGVLKASKDEAAPIHICLIHTSLSHSETQRDDQYTTLSYVEGDNTVTSLMVIDEERFTVIESFANALRDTQHSTAHQNLGRQNRIILQSI